MIELYKYKKNISKELDDDFNKKVKYGKVYYCNKYIFVRKGLNWLFFPLKEIKSIEIIFGSRQLKQCCGAPIYSTQELLITTITNEHTFIRVDETENGNMNKAEKLVDKIIKNSPNIVWKKNRL